jgi:hypothetical protein
MLGEQVVENEEVSGAAKGGTAKGPKSFSYKPIAVTLRQTVSGGGCSDCSWAGYVRQM